MVFGQVVLLVYAILMVAGGLAGAKAGSRVSLIAGSASGLALLVALLVSLFSPVPGFWFGAAIGLVLLVLFASSAVHAEAGDDATRVDLNRASAEELATLPGIGEAKAAAIIEFRTSSGAFSSLEELEGVRGIGPALVAKLRPHVTLGSQGGSKSPSKAGAKNRAASAK